MSGLGKLTSSPFTQILKDKFGILQLKPCFKIVSDEIEWLRLFFRQMLLSREFSDSVVVPPNLYNVSIGAQEQSFIKRIQL